MVSLQTINESNFLKVCALKPGEGQRSFVASAEGILARAYAYREQRSQVFAICAEGKTVGVLLLHDMEEEPACYHLMELLIHSTEQGKGYAREALKILIRRLQKERKYPQIELCVKKENKRAIRLYASVGFADSGYVDPETPGSLCMVYPLKDEMCCEG